MLHSTHGRKCVVVQGPHPCSSPVAVSWCGWPLRPPWKILRLPVDYTGRVPVDVLSGVDLVFWQRRRTVSRCDWLLMLCEACYKLSAWLTNESGFAIHTSIWYLPIWYIMPHVCCGESLTVREPNKCLWWINSLVSLSYQPDESLWIPMGQFFKTGSTVLHMLQRYKQNYHTLKKCFKHFWKKNKHFLNVSFRRNNAKRKEKISAK